MSRKSVGFEEKRQEMSTRSLPFVVCNRESGFIRRNDLTDCVVLTMSSGKDYFKILPEEIILKIIHFLSPKDRFPLERVGDRRLRHLVTALVTNFESLRLRLSCHATQTFILKYHNLDSLGNWTAISNGPSRHDSHCAVTSIRDLMLDDRRRDEFARDLAISCPGIRRFFVTYHGLELVLRYIKSLDGEHSEIQELGVYVPPILARKLWHLLEDISTLSPRLRVLRIICLRHPVLLDSSSWDMMWESLGKKVRILQLEFCHEFDYLHNHFMTSFKGLECLLVDHLEESELGEIVRNNKGLRKLEVKELYSGYHHLAELNKLESLKVIWVKQRLTLETQRFVLESIGTSLREFSIYLREKSSFLRLIPRHCRSIEELTVHGFVLEDKKYFVNNLVKTCRKLSCLKKLNIDSNGFNSVEFLDIERSLPTIQVNRY